MDPITHTIIAVGLLAVSFYIGKRVGRTDGVEDTLTYLIMYGACTEDDIKEANERFDRETQGK